MMTVRLSWVWLAVAMAAHGESLSLAGDWRFRLDSRDEGLSGQWWETRLSGRIRLPGSLQEQGYGNQIAADTPWVVRWGVERKDYPDWRTHPMFEKYRRAGAVKFPYWLQPERHYLGLAWWQREIEIPSGWRGKRVVLFLERCHWKTAVWVGTRPLGDKDSLGAPHVYDLSPLEPGKHTLTIAVDNRMIHPLGVNAHSVGDQTQTTWNGIVGRIELRASDPVWLEEAHFTPNLAARRVRVRAVIGNATGNPFRGRLTMDATASVPARTHAAPAKSIPVAGGAGSVSEVAFDYPLGDTALMWDEFSPAVYRTKLRLETEGGQRSELESAFGLREIAVRGTGLTLNGRTLFLRGTLECAIFPLTGYPPTDAAAWKRIFKAVKEHGLNHVRFHSWFPPEAAFAAADEEGVYLQPECHLWGPVTAKTPALQAWLHEESRRLLARYGNHPSFVMFGLGNESLVEKPIMQAFIAEWKHDPRRLYTGPANANGSMIPDYDYYVGREIGKQRLRYQSGWPPVPENVWFLDRPPQTSVDFREAVALYPKPLISHETVQRCSYPDLDQAHKYTGSLKASYLEIARDQLRERGMLSLAREFTLASGKWQVQQFKEEMEASLRTPGLAGYQLLDLHDFPGQGGALVGVLDAFWDGKGYVTPEEFRKFSGPTVPLARMRKRVWSAEEEFAAAIELAHFGRAPLSGAAAEWQALDAAGKRVAGAPLAPVTAPTGALSRLGEVRLPLTSLPAPAKYRLVVRVAGHENDWDFWLYPSAAERPAPPDVAIASELHDALIRRLEQGATVLLAPPRDRIRGRIRQCFTSIYWNAPWTDGGESETMGILADPRHPVFRSFPTEFHSNWQWFDLLSETRPFALDAWGAEHPWPKDYRPLVQLVDDWNQNRKLAVLAEARVGQGKLMLCAMDIKTDLDRRPAARQFRRSLLEYVAGPQFQPTARIAIELVRELLQ